ncbi:hypothetical protein BDQ12DRAFT_682603 [Crucibulum laeve]|uniref:Extracellular membrane protein CFEM domain-containing protein n=1 Tax=Crucibulum laeve TaxID=68775 RepID=A0A5C3MCH6_9AGAR|nr:hypothetical protein BDQ12DRAFT_682603 [Crucibulum laeve]
MARFSTFVWAISTSLFLFAQQFVLSSPSPYSSVVTRQSSGIDPAIVPVQCKNQCNTFVQATQECTSDSCFCTDAFVAATALCLNCVVSISEGGLSADSAQGVVDELVFNCTVDGHPVKSANVQPNQGERIAAGLASALMIALGSLLLQL